MQIHEIRDQLTKKGAYKIDHKQIIANWLAHNCSVKFELGLTLMPKKVFYKYVPNYKAVKDDKLVRHLNKSELEKASLKFVDILNKVTYKNGYKRHNKKLDVVMAIEGEKSAKDLHTHFALTKPTTMSWNEFARRVRLALKLSSDFETFNPNFIFDKHDMDKQYRYKLDIIDSDWLYYITKELGGKEVHNLYLP